MVSTKYYKFNSGSSRAFTTIMQVYSNELLKAQVFDLDCFDPVEGDASSTTVLQILAKDVTADDFMKFVKCHCPEWRYYFFPHATLRNTLQISDDLQQILSYEGIEVPSLCESDIQQIVESFVKTL